MSALPRWLQHPLTRDLSVDDPRTTARRREIIRSKPALRRIYEEWYRRIRESIPGGPGGVLELGSGAGFLREVVAGAFASDVFLTPAVQLVADGRRIPAQGASLRAIAMVDVLHHVPDCRRFFREAARCVRRGGVIVAVEPWVSSWSRLIYTHLHHEPFLPDAPDWAFAACGPLSGANQALPWIVFERDRATFERDFPEWRISRVEPMMPLRYLLSGGLSLRSLAPCWIDPAVVVLERLVSPGMTHLAMFAHIALERTEKGVSREQLAGASAS